MKVGDGDGTKVATAGLYGVGTHVGLEVGEYVTPWATAEAWQTYWA